MTKDIFCDSYLDGRKLIGEVSMTGTLMKYIKNPNFFAHYDIDIYADKSILNIPLVAAILPLAWLTGSDVTVDVIDRRFIESMDQLQLRFKKVYTEAPFTTKIKADKFVDNNIGKVYSEERVGLLFSGGVDSSYSLITNLDLRPRIIMIWGVDDFPFPGQSKYWENVINTYSNLAKKLELSFNVIKTNVSQILDDRRIEHDFHRQLQNAGVRDRLQHSLLLLPLASPISVNRFDRLLIAASYDESFDTSKYGHRASMPENDERIVWANLQVKHYGFIHRFEKITGAIKEYLKNNDLKLRVCVRRLDDAQLNDSTCYKCLRTIAPLILAGVDPNKCGFHVDNSTFKRIESIFESNILTYTAINYYWNRLQNMIPDKMDSDIHGSKDFFYHLKNVEFKYNSNKSKLFRTIYYMLPYSISKFLFRLYNKIGINIR